MKATSKKRAKHYPAVRTIRLTDPSVVATTVRRVEADRVLSEANRRMYRQSYVYSMKVDMDIDSELAAPGVSVFVLNDTWDLHQAYKFAMKNFYNAMKEEIAHAKGQVGRWMDFKIQSGVASDLLWPLVNNNALAEARLDTGEHQYSQVVDSAGVSRTFSCSQGPSTGTDYSILSEWQNVDSSDSDPNDIRSNTPYQNLTDENDDANRDLLQDQYNEAPYSDTTVTNGAFRKVATLQATPGGLMKLTTGYFDAPLGIVIITGVTGSAGTKGLQVSFQAGDYKGVKATPYATPQLTASKEYEVV